MPYTAPVQDMRFLLQNLCNLDELAQLPGYEEATPDMVDAILEEAGKFADNVLGPLNWPGDQAGVTWDDGAVTTAPGWLDAYQGMAEGGWNAPSAAPDHGGMGLPQVVNACIQEMFQGANMAFQLCPMLTQGAVEALEAYASDELKETYLEKMVTGEWTGTMNLTEPQAGSDLGALRSKAVPEGDHYLISGQKIFITYGEHDMTENIIHLVLARLPDAPEGVRGISLFVVPKFMVGADGSLGARNDVRCVSVEHKLGIHASPTCTMSFGDNGGAVGYLVGEPHKGLPYMFAMMNNARLNVGIQGIGVAEQAFQTAMAYACERKQMGKAIIEHADVRRMLASMRSRVEAARALAVTAALSLDYAGKHPDADIKARHQRRVDLLIPVVKGWSTEMAVDVASLGVQVHGGMGYVEETGAAQFLRDARITTIYEGTTGIQALDLVGRKILRDEGQAVGELVDDIRASANAISSDLPSDLADWDKLRNVVSEAADLIEETTAWLLARGKTDPTAPAAAASAVLDMFGVCLGAWRMVESARAAAQEIAAGNGSEHKSAKLHLTAFYATQIFPEARSKAAAVQNGPAGIMDVSVADLALTG